MSHLGSVKLSPDIFVPCSVAQKPPHSSGRRLPGRREGGPSRQVPGAAPTDGDHPPGGRRQPGNLPLHRKHTRRQAKGLKGLPWERLAAAKSKKRVRSDGSQISMSREVKG